MPSDSQTAYANPGPSSPLRIANPCFPAPETQQAVSCVVATSPPLLANPPSPDPDKNSEESAKQKFLDVGHAFEVLSDPDKRKTYDRYGEEGLKQQQGGGGFHDPFDVFRSAFGFGGQQQQRRGQNMLAELEVELEAIYKGDAMTVSACAVRGREGELMRERSLRLGTRRFVTSAMGRAPGRTRTLSTARLAKDVGSDSFGTNSLLGSSSRSRCTAINVGVEGSGRSTFAPSARAIGSSTRLRNSTSISIGGCQRAPRSSSRARRTRVRIWRREMWWCGFGARGGREGS